MYVNEEDVPLIATTAIAPSNAGRIWKFVATGVALSALGLVAVSVSGGLSYTHSSETQLIEARLQMSREGSLMYNDLSDNEKSALFNNFKSDFARKVVSIAEHLFSDALLL